MQKFEESLPMLMNRALDAVMPRYRAVFAKYNITEQQWRILRVLWEQKSCSTSALAERTLIPAPSMVGIVDRLTSKGLVTRTRCDTDRRRVFIEATQAGTKLQARIEPQIDRVYADLLADTGERDWKALIRTLKKFISANEIEPAQTGSLQ